MKCKTCGRSYQSIGRFETVDENKNTSNGKNRIRHLPEDTLKNEILKYLTSFFLYDTLKLVNKHFFQASIDIFEERNKKDDDNGIFKYCISLTLLKPNISDFFFKLFFQHFFSI